MITVKKAKKESRKRDKKRDRWILQIGEYRYHMDIYEMLYLNMVTHKIIKRHFNEGTSGAVTVVGWE